MASELQILPSLSSWVYKNPSVAENEENVESFSEHHEMENTVPWTNDSVVSVTTEYDERIEYSIQNSFSSQRCGEEVDYTPVYTDYKLTQAQNFLHQGDSEDEPVYVLPNDLISASEWQEDTLYTAYWNSEEYRQMIVHDNPLFDAAYQDVEQDDIFQIEDETSESYNKKMPPHQRVAANQRERRRMNIINQAFEVLRNHIPVSECERKLSKVDTLRAAIEYIKCMDHLLKTTTPVSSKRSGCDKIIVHTAVLKESTKNGEETGDIIVSYSLTWSRNKKRSNCTFQGGRKKIFAQTWNPEFPGQHNGYKRPSVSSENGVPPAKKLRRQSTNHSALQVSNTAPAYAWNSSDVQHIYQGESLDHLCPTARSDILSAAMPPELIYRESPSAQTSENGHSHSYQNLFQGEEHYRQYTMGYPNEPQILGSQDTDIANNYISILSIKDVVASNGVCNYPGMTNTDDEESYHDVNRIPHYLSEYRASEAVLPQPQFDQALLPNHGCTTGPPSTNNTFYQIQEIVM